ncbi:MAG: type II secretion system F family protein [Lachnospiraceae bacterium]
MERKIYSYRELAAFCLQISMLSKAGIALDEGLSVMAEDAGSEEEKKMLLFLSEEVELGEPFFTALEKTKAFPDYVVRMAKLGQHTGTMDQMMESLSVYYEKEYYMLRNIRNALTYPVIMIFMLLVVLFVLFTKVMPVFENVYEQLGAQISPLSKAAMQLGGAFSGVALVVGVILVVIIGAVYLLSLAGKKVLLAEKLINQIKRKSQIALSIAKRRFTSVLALTLKSGLELEKGLDLAKELVENSKVEEQIDVCGRQLEDGVNYYEAMKNTGLFNGFHIQMIKVGNRSGRLDSVMEQLSEDYEQQADVAIDNMISRFEPTLVAILAVSVGMILLSVMLPLVGVLSAIG